MIKNIYVVYEKNGDWERPVEELGYENPCYNYNKALKIKKEMEKHAVPQWKFFIKKYTIVDESKPLGSTRSHKIQKTKTEKHLRFLETLYKTFESMGKR